MTVSTTNNSTVLTANGSTTAFPFTFLVLDEDHLIVQRRVTATSVVDKTYTAGEYSVTGIGTSSGTVTISPAPATGNEIIVSRIVPYTQDLEISNQGGFYPETVEEQLDLIVMQVQQLAAESERSLKVMVGDTALELGPIDDIAEGDTLVLSEDGLLIPSGQSDYADQLNDLVALAQSIQADFEGLVASDGYYYDPVTQTRYTWAAVNNELVMALAPHIWIDPVDGSDSANGLTEATAIKTFAALEAHDDWVSGATVVIKRPEDGAVIRDGLYAPSADYRTIVSYGPGPLPLFDCTDEADNADFTVNGTYATCYDISWSHNLETGSNRLFRVFEDGKPLKRKATLAEVDATAGTYYYSGNPSAGVAKTITIHPYGSTNAVSDGKTYEITAREAAIYLNDNCRIEGFYGRRNANNDGSFRLGEEGRANIILAEEGTKHAWVFGGGVFGDVIAVNCVDDEYNPEGSILGTNFVTDSAGRTVVMERCGFIVDPSVYGDTIKTGQLAGTSYYAHDTGISEFTSITMTDCWMSKVGGAGPVAEAMTVTDFYYAGPPESANPFAFAAYFPITVRGGVFCDASRIVDGPSPDVEGIVAFNETVTASGGLFPVFSTSVVDARIVNNLFVLGSGLNENQSVIYYGAEPGSTLTMTGNIFDGFRQTVTVDDADMAITAQNNVYRSHTGNAMIFTVDGVQKSFAQWQALGYDSNGVEDDPEWQTGIKPSISVPDVRLLAGGAGALRHAGAITVAYVESVMDKPLTLADAKTWLNAIAHTPVTSEVPVGSGSGWSLSDGDKGDITVSAGGATWTIDPGVVSLAKMADLAANSIIGNNTGSSATPLALTATQVRTLLNVADGATANTGTVTSVALSAPTGFAVAGSPVTTTGTLALTYDTGYQGYTTTEASKLAGIEAAADVTDATNVAAAGAVMESDTSTASMSFVIDEDNMATNSATKVPTQQSVKTYVDTEVASIGGSPPDMIALAADYTLTSTTSEQKLFNTTTNGRLNLATGLYKFTCMVAIDTMSATSGNANFSILGAGSATLAGQHIDARGLDNSSAINGAAVARGGATALGASTFSGNTATAGSGTALAIVYDGYFRVTSAGTIVPSIALTTAAAAVVKAGTIFTCERIAGHADYSQGSWD